ncbi:hypothetical protein DVH05_009427 [Phytophthora capsici]|nr:hypothetical protein DVH05_009427 [Phytophthora capsici]
MLECQNCGAVGDSFFSENYFGEMVCELCGTQSFLQARNETQDAEDMGLDITTVLRTLKRRVVRKKKRDADGNIIPDQRHHKKKKTDEKENPKLPELLDCVIATQMVLDFMARQLVERVGADTFPAEEYPMAVKQLWFKFLKTWGVKGTKPLLRCYNEFFLFYSREEEKDMEPAVTLDMLEQWDAEWEKKKDTEEEKEQTEEKEPAKKNEDKPRKKANEHSRRRFDLLNEFSIVDMVGILVLASRVLNLGLLPSDFAEWVNTGVIPYHNSLATCCAGAADVRESVKFIVYFFHSVLRRNNMTTVKLTYSTHYLQYHMGLRLPPLNVPLAAHRLCASMGFPGEVYRNFLWITGFMNSKGDIPEVPMLLQAEADAKPKFKLEYSKKEKDRVDGILESESGIVAHLVVAVKMCANWHEWIFDRQHREDDEETKDDTEGGEWKAPPVAAVLNPHLLPRRDLDSLTEFARQVFIDPDKSGVPENFHEHVKQLQRIQTTDDLLTPGNDPRRDRSEKLKQNDLYAYPARYANGILAETDAEIEERMESLRSGEREGNEGNNTFFYPLFHQVYLSAMPAAYENILEILCRKIDAPIALVLQLVTKLDKRVQSLINHFERSKLLADTLREGRYKWETNNGPTRIIHASLVRGRRKQQE